MRKYILLPVIIFLVVLSCNRPIPFSSGLLNVDSLKSEFLTINIKKDTLVMTQFGAWLKIDSGSLISEKDEVVLEIKEAYTISQMVNAGLTTQSNGQLLSSGGMIYINVAAGQKIAVSKPIRVAIPTDCYDKNMELYKAGTKSETGFNWSDPKKLEKSLLSANLESGEVLFQQKCASCHGIGKENNGPDLAQVVKRLGPLGDEGVGVFYHRFRKGTNAVDGFFITDTSGVSDHINFTDTYICNLISLFNNKEVDLSEDFGKNQTEWLKIYKYIENESNRRNLPYPKHAYLKDCTDSCFLYSKIQTELENRKEQAELKRKELINENGSLVKKIPDPTWQRNNNPPPPDFDSKVQPKEYGSIYYQFTIESFGWYNIDMLVSQKDNVQQSELFVRVVGQYREKIKIYLIIPSEKVYGEGGETNRVNDEYSFYKKDGSIQLPQNTKAYVLAVTEVQQSIAFALKEFTTSTKQNIEMSLNLSSKEEFQKIIGGLSFEKLSITAGETRNSKEILQTEKTIKELEEELKMSENLKPKGCDCDCGIIKISRQENQIQSK